MIRSGLSFFSPPFEIQGSKIYESILNKLEEDSNYAKRKRVYIYSFGNYADDEDEEDED